MAKIVLIDTLELRSDKNAEAFEKFVTEELSTFFWHTSGYSHHVLKGVEGDRVGKYILYFEIKGDKAQEHYFSPEDVRDAIYAELHKNHPENPKMLEKLKTFVTGFGTDRTDYIEVGSQGSSNESIKKMVHISMLELRSDMKSEDFESFCTDEWPSAAWIEGHTGYVLKGHKGIRTDKYIMLVAADGDEGQSLFTSPKDIRSGAWARTFSENPQNPKMRDTMDSFVSGWHTDTVSTMYVEIE
jgi:hypothetical protein